MKSATAPITQNGCPDLICTMPFRCGNLQFKDRSFHLVVHQNQANGTFRKRSSAFSRTR
jgi:hypothetical protein